MSRPANWQKTIGASKRHAILAIKLYNDPLDPLALEGFVIHMHLAWLYLFQAKYQKLKQEFRVRDSRYKALRYEKIDGEYRTQPLSWFVSDSLAESSPVRKNIDFFIRLRNKMEHRHEETTKALADAISGESHSFLLNYEEALVAIAGQIHSLAPIIRFPVFLGGFSDRGKAELLKQSQAIPDEYKSFVADYYTSLGDEILTDPRFSLRITVVLEKANRSGDLAMTFINPDELEPEEKARLEESLKHGTLITREKLVSVVNKGLFKPQQAQNAVNARSPFVFNNYDFTLAHQKNGCRPPGGSLTPHKTKKDFCMYDEPNRSYLYTQSWVDYLARKCQTAEGFFKATGRKAKLKSQAKET